MSLLSALLLVSTSFASPEFTSVIKKDETSASYCPSSETGKVCRMNYAQARAFCAKNFGGLPTVRDFAAWSKARGAKGILEANGIEEGKQPAGYYLVASIYEQEGEDSFYFSHAGYTAPPSQLLEKDSYWTRSTVLKKPHAAHVFYSAHGGGGGADEDHLKSKAHAVLCLQ